MEKQSHIKIKNSNEIFTFPIIVSRKNYSLENNYNIGIIKQDLYITSKSQLNIYKDINLFNIMPEFEHFIPLTTDINVDIMFPEYRDYNISEYVIEAYMYIGQLKICIGSYLLKTSDLLATDNIYIYDNIRYYEKLSVQFPDPFKILYTDEWKDLREKLCGETPNTNNSETQLILELTPKTGSYITKDYVGGYTNIDISNVNNHIHLDLWYGENYDIISQLHFNEVYNNDFILYIKEIYDIDISEFVVKTELVLKDDDNIYKAITNTFNSNSNILNVFYKKNLNLDWSYWTEGLSFLASFSIHDKYGEEILTVLSNILPVTMESFAYLIENEKFNLDKINMITYNLDVVNKIQKKIVNITNNGNDNSKIINNIFVFSNPIENLIVYPSVKQHILLPLNGYKNKVDVFYVKIEDIIFPEEGRNAQGVIFAIDGNLLPNITSEGQFFILNNEKELVTTGKYIYK